MRKKNNVALFQDFSHLSFGVGMTFFQITSKIFPISKKVFVAPIGDVLVIEFSTKTEASKKKVVAINLEKNHVRKFY